MTRLEGRVALITGSGRNIGRATALRFAAEGADIVVNSRKNLEEAESVAEEVRALGRRAVAITADVSDREAVFDMVARASTELGTIDVLVNCAGIRPSRPFLELTMKDWDRLRGVVLDGAIHCTQAALPGMVEKASGSVLFILGEGAWLGGPERGHVGAAKLALVSLMRSLASEFSVSNVRFNAVSPGTIETPDGPEFPPSVVKRIPLGRLGHVDDVANACLYLSSDEAAWVTGQTLHVNGGFMYH